MARASLHSQGSSSSLSDGVADIHLDNSPFRSSLYSHPPKDESYVIVAAIDFGTTFSGYAFSFSSSQDDIRMFKDWGASVSLQGYKTPTCVLTDKEGGFEGFGYEAENRFANLIDGEDRDFCLYTKFKMVLHRVNKLSKTTNITAKNGQIRPAIQVFSMALKYLKDHLMDTVSKQTSQPPSPDMIRWVITVPAIWSDASKQFMRESALEAGIIDEIHSRKLMIALEPEAASLWCRNLDVDHFMSKAGAAKSMEAGSRYLVLDAGGGTLDVTAHQLKENGHVRELHQASGGALGGTKVDDNFIKLLEDIFTTRVIQRYKNDCPADWLQLMCNFERKKRALKPNDNSTTNIQIPWEFGNKYRDVTGKDLKTAFEERPKDGVRFAGGMLVLSNEITMQLFKPSVDGIVRHIEELLKQPELAEITYILMVGGFSEAAVLQEAVKQHFGHLKVLIPHDASLCVIKGAVLFGHQPKLISTRVARKTYGIKCQRPFNAQQHDPNKKRFVNGMAKAVDLFDTIVRKGDEIDIGTVKTLNFTPSRADQTGADILIYGCDKTSVKYVTEDGVEQLGHLFINLAGEGKSRSIQVSITFGGPELFVEVKDMTNPGSNIGRMIIQFLMD